MPENGPSNTRRRAWEVFACRNDIFYDDEKASSIFQVQMTTCLTYTGMKSEFFKVLHESSGIFARGFTDEEKLMAMNLMDRMMENARNEKYGSSKPE